MANQESNQETVAVVVASEQIWRAPAMCPTGDLFRTWEDHMNCSYETVERSVE